MHSLAQRGCTKLIPVVMKMKTKLITLLLLFSVNCFSQIVDIPDPNFKAALLSDELINTNGDDEIQVAEAEAADYVYVSNSDINSLEGINAFVNIYELDCRENNLTSLDISQLVGLETLFAQENSLNSIEFPITSVLSTLNLSYNSFTDLSLLELDGLSNLYSLYLSQNPIGPSITLMQENLRGLNLSSCGIEEIDLSGLPNIESLGLETNPLVLSAPLSSETLELLNASMCDLDELDTSLLPSLKYLTAANNNLSNLNLEANLQLEVLWIMHNDFTSLNLSDLPMLEGLWVYDNDLTELNINNGVLSDNGELLAFDENPNLNFICADSGEIDNVNSLLELYGYTAATVSTDCSLAVNDPLSITNWSLYPNPSRGVLNVNTGNSEAKSITIFDMSGRKVFAQNLAASQTYINISGLTPALYFIQLETAFGKSVKRLIKE